MADSSQSVDQILVGNVPVVAAVKCHEGLQVGCSFLYLINVNYVNMLLCCAQNIWIVYILVRKYFQNVHLWVYFEYIHGIPHDGDGVHVGV